MGMGEPLNNYENVKRAVEFLIDSKRLALSPKHVTVSTVGVLKNMQRLSDELPSVNLAFSMHAPNQTVRLKIVPAAKAHPLEKLLEAVDYHILKNNQCREKWEKNKSGGSTAIESPPEDEDDEMPKTVQRYKVNDKGVRVLGKGGVMIEYILIQNINDRPEHAHELAALLAPRRDNILLNLIPYNPTEVAEDFQAPTQEEVDRFHQICILPEYQIHTRVRQEKGQDIAGACGQLALVKAKQANLEGHIERDLEDIAKETIKSSSSRSHSASQPSSSASTVVNARPGNISPDKQLASSKLTNFIKESNLALSRSRQWCLFLFYANIFIPTAYIFAKSYFNKF